MSKQSYREPCEDSLGQREALTQEQVEAGWQLVDGMKVLSDERLIQALQGKFRRVKT